MTKVSDSRRKRILIRAKRKEGNAIVEREDVREKKRDVRRRVYGRQRG